MKQTVKKMILPIISVMLLGANAKAATIFEAMSEAYNYNPTLHGKRASSGAANEDAASARSGFRPTVAVGAQYADTHAKRTGTNTIDGYSKGYNTSIRQSVFNGFQTYNAIKAADNAAKAEINDLYDVEQSVLLSAATAYLDVVRDEAIVKLQKNNEKLLKKQLDETIARYDVGEVTKTDIAQARASYAQARSELMLAEGNLAVSKANYLNVIGVNAEDVRFPENLSQLFPEKYDDALAYANENNYALKAAQKSLKAAKHDVSGKKGALLPEVTLSASTGKTTVSSHTSRDPSTSSTEYMVDVSMPLYAGGATRAAIRKSKYRRWAAEESVRAAENAVEFGVTNGWEMMQTAKSNISAIKEQVKASSIALQGTQKEEALGNRTGEVKARHDYYVSGLQLLQAMGKLTAKKIGLNVQYYDAEKNYQNTKGKWLTLSIDK